MTPDTAAVNAAIPLWQLIQQDTTPEKQASSHGGEYHAPCPFCGGTDRFVCQLDRNGQTLWLCRSCTGAKWQDAISYLMRRDGLAFQDVLKRYEGYKPQPKPKASPVAKRKPTSRPAWFGMSPDDYATAYMTEADKWQQYKPVTQDAIARYRLGYGVLPSPTRCQCPRLLVPIFDNGRLVCLRGRLISKCTCTPKPQKWLASGGFTLDNLPLYNNRPSGIVVILENPVDAIMMTENPTQAVKWLAAGMPHLKLKIKDALIDAIGKGLPPLTAVATLSIYYWRPEWVIDAGMTFVAFDNDLSGNGGADRRKAMMDAYRQNNPERPLPEPRGAALATQLNACLYNWHGFAGKDYGDYIAQFKRGEDR